MGKVVYLGHNDMDGQREGSPASGTVMRYVLSVLTRLGDKVVTISPSFPKNGVAAPRECRTENGYEVIFPAAMKKSRNPLLRWMRVMHHRRAVDKELKRQVKDGDTLVVYHSLLLMDAVQRLRRYRRVRLVLQVCEVYSDVAGDAAMREKELAFIQTADAYVFMCELMARQLNTANKPYAVCLGTYETPDLAETSFNDGKIHCVYAGTFDAHKGGAAVAAEAAAFLPSNYHVHLLGFGTADEVAAIKETVARVSADGGCTVTYDGCLRGEDYLRFIQKCAVGLSTQNPEGAYNATSFPSKILAYMANGLRVLSVRTPAIDTSEPGAYVYFYEEQTPRAVADAILRMDMNDGYDGQAVLRGLDERFVVSLRNVIG